MTQANSYFNSAPPFTSALVLSEQESSAAVDKVTLRAAGIPRLRYADSGLDVAGHLAERVRKILLEETEIIVCLPKLKDITAAQFAHLVRSHPLLVHIPLLAIASDPAQVAPLKQSGFNDVILRPFNTTSLSNKLHQIAQDAAVKHKELLEYLRVHPGIPSSEKFQELIKQYAPVNPEDLSPIASYKQGVRLMRNFHWEEALPFLEKASGDHRVQGNAYMALYAFWTVHQDPVRVESSLRDAVQAFLDSQQWDKAVHAAQRLREEFPASADLVLPELERRARQNQHETVTALTDLAKKIGLANDDIAEAVYRGAQASMTPAQTLPTMVSVLKANGFEHISERIGEASGLGKESDRKRWAWFTSRTGKDDKPARARDEEPAENHASRETLKLSDVADSSPRGEKFRPGAPQADDQGRVIAPLGDRLLSPYLEPSSLGDAWTVMRGTLRLAKKKK